MGGIYSNMPPKVKVDPESPAMYDPLYGFPEGRKKKEMKVTLGEMECAQLELFERDYCAHKLIDFKSCIATEFPMNWRCKYVRHHYHQCLYDEELTQFKEYEREKRLLQRQIKKEDKAKKLAAKIKRNKDNFSE